MNVAGSVRSALVIMSKRIFVAVARTIPMLSVASVIGLENVRAPANSRSVTIVSLDSHAVTMPISVELVNTNARTVTCVMAIVAFRDGNEVLVSSRH